MYSLEVVVLLLSVNCFITDIPRLLKKEPNLTDLLTLLANIEHEWHKIGIALEVKHSVLESCDRSNKDDGYKLFKVIKTWTTSMTSEVTWEAIIAAVESPIVKHKSTAVKMRMFLAKPEVQFKYEQMSGAIKTFQYQVHPKHECMIDVGQISKHYSDAAPASKLQVRPKSKHKSRVEQTSEAKRKKY